MSTARDSAHDPFGQPPDRHTLISDAQQHTRGGSRRRRRARDPRFYAAVIVLAMIVSIIAAISSASGTARSAYTQSHGVKVIGTLGPISNSKSCGRSCSTTFSAPVLLAAPVHGHLLSTLHGPGDYRAPASDQTMVLVDPKDPSYAELPGQRLDSSSLWFVLAAVGLGLGAAMVISLWRVLRSNPGVRLRRLR